jgi:hypothetical protein
MPFNPPKKPFTTGQAAVGVFTRCPWNPPDRTALEGRGFKEILTSIEESGQHVPITVTGIAMVIDGHRRLSALQHLGRKAYYTVHPVDPYDLKAIAKVYWQINKVRTNFGAANRAWSYGAEPEAVDPKTRRKLARIEAALGADGYARFRELQGTDQNWDFTRQIAKLIEWKTPSALLQISEWIILFKRQYNMRKLSKVIKDPSVRETVKAAFICAIMEGKKLDLDELIIKS